VNDAARQKGRLREGADADIVGSFCTLQLKFVPARIASYATQGAGALVLANVMRIPCFGRRITIGRASIIWPGAN
jgi:hypothetical protein